MKLDIKAVAITLGLVWVLAMFLTGVLNLIYPPYGQAFLEVMASIYPGYTAAASFGQVVIGAIYSLVDGAIAGAILAWLYNLIVGLLAKG